MIRVLKKPVIPNVFSPNGDGINDVWDIKYLAAYPGATVDVFNRGGQMIFRSQGYTTPWNGTYKGNPLPVGTYYYVIDPKNGREKISGSITILK
jgi:gliding motility-associated-like protein